MSWSSKHALLKGSFMQPSLASSAHAGLTSSDDMRLHVGVCSSDAACGCEHMPIRLGMPGSADAGREGRSHAPNTARGASTDDSIRGSMHSFPPAAAATPLAVPNTLCTRGGTGIPGECAAARVQPA
eukprot:358234-Chlamydomonas_euryale.AAC.4